MTPPPAAPWLLALHSSSDTLGLGLLPLDPAAAAEAPPRLACHPLGRALSNALLPCLEALLPADQWPGIGRLAVATGPGGFTGTRLTVVLARTLAQQLSIPLDGPSSFLLIARRLRRQGLAAPGDFWVCQELPRRGLVAGLYGLEAGRLRERLSPRLLADQRALEALAPAATPVHSGAVLLPDDVLELLEIAREAAAAGEPAPWGPVLPIYPTSPVGVA